MVGTLVWQPQYQQSFWQKGICRYSDKLAWAGRAASAADAIFASTFVEKRFAGG
jgi:hypothetical protein